jgi:hypothetical protein
LGSLVRLLFEKSMRMPLIKQNFIYPDINKKIEVKNSERY